VETATLACLDVDYRDDTAAVVAFFLVVDRLVRSAGKGR
jgi:hypothetical protein